jgi:hypothetical protein
VVAKPVVIKPERREYYPHQKEAIERFKDDSEIALFFEMGCVDSQTEYFNGVCWKPIAEYILNEKVLQFNLDGSTELVEPLKYHKYSTHNDMVHFKTARGMDQVLSLDHKLLAVNRSNYNIQPEITVQDLLDKQALAQNYLCPIAFNRYKGNDTTKWKLTEYETRLMIAVIADGSFARRSKTNWCRVNLKKQYKAERLSWLLEQCQIPYRTHHTLNRDGYYRFYFYAPIREKVFSSHWYNAPVEWITDEVLKWDDSEIDGKYNTRIKESADFIQFVFASIAKRTSIQVYDRLEEGHGLLYQVIISEQPPYTTWYTQYTQDGYPKNYTTDYKYCFTVPSGYLVLRRNGGIFVTGNCGKSATILAIIASQFRHEKLDALLIIAPNDVHRQWAIEQIIEWLDVPFEIQCLYGRGGAKEAYPFEDKPGVLPIVCVNIDTFSTPTKWIDVVNWANSRKTFIVLDEATVIKNVSAKRTQRILYEFNDVTRKRQQILSSKVKSVGRAILTGTPVTNGPMDLWAMMEFLRPNFFGRNWYSFQSHFGMFTKMNINGRAISIPLNEDTWAAVKGINSYGEAYAIFGCSEDTFNTIHAQDVYEGPYKHADELRQLIAPVSMFKQLKDCADLPPQIYNQRLLKMSDTQQSCYNSMCAELLAEYAGHTATALNKMTAIIRLQQISSGFIFDRDYDAELNEEDAIARLYGLYDVTPDDRVQWIGTSNPKLDAIYRDVDESVKPVIVITRFSAEAARIFEDLSAKMKCCLMTGWKRIGSVEEFKVNKYQVMVANSSVVQHGFNLQNSHSILFYSNTFSLETRLQTEGRIFRLGQTEPCLYTDYIYENSVDEKIISALKLKRNLLDYIRSASIKEIVNETVNS